MEPCVLIIDDNPDDRESLVRTLKKVEGATYRYLESADGLKGAEMAAYTIVVTILAVGLDNIVPPDIQERAWKFHVKRQLDGRRLA